MSIFDSHLEFHWDLCMWILEKHAPPKKKCTHNNPLPHMNKELPKTIMHSLKLCNNFQWNRSQENWKKYSKLTYCVSLLRRIKKNYYKNLSKTNVANNKNFCKTITSFLSNKVLSNEKKKTFKGKKKKKIDKKLT